jgi:inosine triphosphate pyrophosphatase
MKLTFVTGNSNKLKEVRHVLADFEIEGLDLKTKEIQGEPEEVISHKAQEACRIAKKSVFVEDTTLSLHALNGLPGPYVKHFIRSIGLEGLYRIAACLKDNRAQATSHVAYAVPGKKPRLFSSILQGTIVKPRGNGWGWDNIFVPEGKTRTYGETADTVKERSFRKGALIKFRDFLDGK